jgi:hypothetical protein
MNSKKSHLDGSRSPSAVTKDSFQLVEDGNTYVSITPFRQRPKKHGERNIAIASIYIRIIYPKSWEL